MGILDIVGREVRTTRTVDLGDFAEGYRGATFEVNVTPSRGHLQEWMEITEFIAREAARKDLHEDQAKAVMAQYDRKVAHWLAATWAMDVGEVEQIRDALKERNPLAWEWLQRRTTDAISGYRSEVLKN